MSDFEVTSRKELSEKMVNAHKTGRASMKKDVLQLFTTELLSRDFTLQKIADRIEEIE